MKSKISALMDGELETHEASEPLGMLARDQEAFETWRAYHLISDALQDTRTLSPDFTPRFAARLAQEPTVLAPRRLAVRRESARWIGLSAAASVAAVAMVGWLAFSTPPGASPDAVAVAQQESAASSEMARVPPPQTANDYLLVHQGYSPRLSLQGVAPYVRTVADPQVERRAR
jgi:sigma-E factor negative regulatory protein RseA